jgi:large subunit ribosomal protein L1
MSINTNNFKDALKELKKKNIGRKFNQTIELIVNLRDIDLKKPEGKIQQTVELPYKINKKVNVCVFATGDLALRAKRSGADLVLDQEEIENLANDKKKQRKIANKMDFFISITPFMSIVGKVFGSILGPRGKMPTPIAPMANIENEIDKHRRLISVKTRGQPVLQCRVGTENMLDDEVIENILAVLRGIERKLKRGIKNIDSIYLKATMGSPIKVKI